MLYDRVSVGGGAPPPPLLLSASQSCSLALKMRVIKSVTSGPGAPDGPLRPAHCALHRMHLAIFRPNRIYILTCMHASMRWRVCSRVCSCACARLRAIESITWACCCCCRLPACRSVRDNARAFELACASAAAATADRSPAHIQTDNSMLPRPQPR